MKDKSGRPLTFSQIVSKVMGRIRAIRLEFVTGFLWWGAGWIPSHHIRRFFYRLAGMKIGRGSTIHMMVRLFDPSHITIGQGTIIGEKVTLDGRRQLPGSKGELIIGSHVDIASGAMIWTSQHDIHSQDMHPVEKRVEIEDYVFIGPRAIILPGVTIKQGAVVAAGAVVTKDVSPKTIVAGIPAVPIGQRRVETLSYRLGRARLFQ